MPKRTVPSLLIIRFSSRATFSRWRGDVDPAALATELTARDDRNEQKRRKVLGAPPPPFVELHRANALQAEVVGELRHHLRTGFGHDALREGEQHGQVSETGGEHIRPRKIRTFQEHLTSASCPRSPPAKPPKHGSAPFRPSPGSLQLTAGPRALPQARPGPAAAQSGRSGAP